MKNSRSFLIAMVALSWSSLLFLKRPDFKRYLPAAIFMGIVTKLLNSLAKKRIWWWFYKSIHPKVSASDTWAWGLFFPISLWILKWTYGNLRLYFKCNFILHTLFVFPGLIFLKKVGIVSLVRINKLQYFLILFFRETLLYSFQFIKEYIDSRKEYISSVNGESQDKQG